MNPARFRQIREIVLEAVDVPADARAALLQQRCAGDADLQSDVESLLAHDSERDDNIGAGLASIPLNAFDAIASEPLDAVDQTPPELPERIGKYQIIDVLGHGGMGTVYRAVQSDPHREVAVKVLHPNRVSRPTLGRFRNEAKILATLDHPGIVPILEAGGYGTNSSATPFLVMPLVEGRPLLQFASEEGLDIRARLELLLAIGDAVAYAHQRAIIHRDLKPPNILVTNDGQPRVLDFGIARIADGDTPTASLQTSAGEILGTLAYMSPEQALGDPDGIDVRTDVYALGVIGYQLLSGRLPLEIADVSVVEAIRRIDEDRPPKLGTLDPKLHGDLSTVIGMALEHDKDRRYGSVAAFTADLRRYLEHQPVTARSPSFGYHVSCFIRRRRRSVAAASLAIAMVITMSIVALVGWIQVGHTNRLLGTLYQSEVATLIDVLPRIPFPDAGATEEPELAARLAPHRAATERSPENVDIIRFLADELEQQSNKELRSAPSLAFAHRLEALRLRSRIARLEPQQLENYKDLSIAVVLVGDAYTDAGRRMMSSHCYRVSLAIDEALVELRPESVHYRDNRFWSYRRMWTIARWNGDYDLGAQFRQRLLPEARALVAAQPNSAVRYRALVEALELDSMNSPNASIKIKRLEEAIDAGQRSVDLGGGRVVDLRRQIQTVRLLQHALTSDHRFERAGQLLGDIDALVDQLATQTEAASWERSMLNKDRTTFFMRQGHWDETIRYGLAALDTLPHTGQDRRLTHIALGQAYAARGERVNALHHAEQAIELSRVAAESPGVKIRDITAYAEILLNPPISELRDPTLALAFAERAVRLSFGVEPHAVSTLANAQVANGDPQAAERTLAQAVKQLSTDTVWYRDLLKKLEDIRASLKSEGA